MSARPLQHQVFDAVKRHVDAWRGFGLGAAADSYPDEAPRYEPTNEGESSGASGFGCRRPGSGLQSRGRESRAARDRQWDGAGGPPRWIRGGNGDSTRDDAVFR